jgi:hypothetical protein
LRVIHADLALELAQSHKRTAYLMQATQAAWTAYCDAIALEQKHLPQYAQCGPSAQTAGKIPTL